MAAKTETPEIALDKSEAGLLASAVAQVAEHYNFLKSVSPEALAWANLAQVAAMVYGPRYMAFRLRKSIEKKGGQNNA